MTRAEAHALLDRARAGEPIDDAEIELALSITGDLKNTLGDLLSIVIDSPVPMRASDLAGMLGLSKDHTAAKLRILRNRGYVAPTKNGGRDAAWAPLDKAERIRQSVENAKRERDYQRARAERRSREADQWAESRPVRVIVPAGQWERGASVPAARASWLDVLH